MNQSLQKMVRVSVLLGVILFAVSGYIWWTQIVTDPSRVFWSTVEKGLATNSVTRTLEYESQGNASSGITAVHLLGTAHAQSINTITDSSSNSVKTETILQPSATYTRILDVKSGTSIERTGLNRVLGAWAREDLSGEVVSGDLMAAIAGNLPSLPIAQLNQKDRGKIVAYARDNNVFDFRAKDVKKTNKDGRKVYEYTVTIKPEPYISMMKKIGEMTGVNEHDSIDPDLYKDQDAVTETITIDVFSRRVLSVTDKDGIIEAYSGYGIVRKADLPKETITFDELQQRFADITTE